MPKVFSTTFERPEVENPPLARARLKSQFNREAARDQWLLRSRPVGDRIPRMSEQSDPDQLVSGFVDVATSVRQIHDSCLSLRMIGCGEPLGPRSTMLIVNDTIEFQVPKDLSRGRDTVYRGIHPAPDPRASDSADSQPSI